MRQVDWAAAQLSTFSAPVSSPFFRMKFSLWLRVLVLRMIYQGIRRLPPPCPHKLKKKKRSGNWILSPLPVSVCRLIAEAFCFPSFLTSILDSTVFHPSSPLSWTPLFSILPHLYPGLRPCPILKPNSWTDNFVEVSGHNRESSQTWGFCIQCLHYKPVSNHFCSRGGGGGGE